MKTTQESLATQVKNWSIAVAVILGVIISINSYFIQSTPLKSSEINIGSVSFKNEFENNSTKENNQTKEYSFVRENLIPINIFFLLPFLFSILYIRHLKKESKKLKPESLNKEEITKIKSFTKEIFETTDEFHLRVNKYLENKAFIFAEAKFYTYIDKTKELMISIELKDFFNEIQKELNLSNIENLNFGSLKVENKKIFKEDKKVDIKIKLEYINNNFQIKEKYFTIEKEEFKITNLEKVIYGKASLTNYCADTHRLEIYIEFNKEDKTIGTLKLNRDKAKELFANNKTQKVVNKEGGLYLLEKDTHLIEPNLNIVIIDGLMYQNQPFKAMNWEKAKEYAKNLRLGGFNDWRLATREELNKLGNIELYGTFDNEDNWKKWFNKNKDSRGDSFFIRKEFIENINDEYGWFWTLEEKDSTDAWVVRFNNGHDYWNRKTLNRYVLCVRE